MDRFERAIEQIERGEPGTASDMLKRVIDECKALRKQLAGLVKRSERWSGE